VSWIALWALPLLLAAAPPEMSRPADEALSDEERDALSANYDTPPRLVKQTKPVYPLRPFRRRLEGVIEVEMVIDEEGLVRRAYVIKPKGAPDTVDGATADLNQAALDAVRAWRFEPARKDGRPVPTIARAPVSFRITDDKKKAPTAQP